MARILVPHHTTDGQTRRICEALRQSLVQAGDTVELADLSRPGVPDPAGFDKVVVGASIRYGHHAAAVFDFVRRHRVALDSRPSAFFSVNIVARKPNKNTPETNPYLIKFLARSGWRPRLTGVFAGRLDYPRYGFFDRQMIRLIMLVTRGPTDPSATVEFTDWDKVAEFAGRIQTM